MLRRWAFLLSLSLTGCGHNLYLVGQSTGTTGHAHVVTAGNSSGPIDIDLGGTRYTGRWVYVPEGGSVGFGNAIASSGGTTGTAFGSFTTIPTGGNGSIIATADSGKRLRCAFDYSEWGSTGVGLCQDSQGERYDLQID
jgi:hypothetical protein